VSGTKEEIKEAELHVPHGFVRATWEAKYFCRIKTSVIMLPSKIQAYVYFFYAENGEESFGKLYFYFYDGDLEHC
jgi:hypothetical protein